MHEAIAIRPQNAKKIEDIGRMLNRGRVKLTGPMGENLSIPEPLYQLLKDAVTNLAQGRSLVLIPEEQQLTTQEAGELLGVSRPYLIRLLDAGEIPYSLVGRHRRIQMSDLVEYAKRRVARRAALDKMARDAYDAGLYDRTIGIPEGGRDE